ncbi:MAG: hypothetical protein U9N60_09395 [Thermodesulfobacteriota bacterium]|nr:hypothetical protein [Thermodesulfobacteriota bacterium]
MYYPLQQGQCDGDGSAFGGGQWCWASRGLQTRWPGLQNREEVRFPLSPPFVNKPLINGISLGLMNRSITIGTAGHADHGKTALVWIKTNEVYKNERRL